MGRWLSFTLVVLLAALAGCSCSSIPESPPVPGPTIELKHNGTVGPDGSGAGTKVEQPIILLPEKK